MNELTTIPKDELPIARQEPSPSEMLSAIVRGGITPENVSVFEKSMDIAWKMEERQNEKSYVSALIKLQSECQNVVATKDVDGKFRYAPFLDIWNAVRPAVERNQFTLQWSQEHLGDKVKVTLTLQHAAGHKRDFTYSMRLGSNAPGTPSGAQAPVLDSQAESRAKRRLLMDCLNVVVDAVSSAEDVGDGSLASHEESDALFKRLVALGGDENSQKRFLALAGVDSWDRIPKVILPILERLMMEKERAASRKAGQ